MTLVDCDEYLKAIREGLKQSVDYFASQDKFIRESYVVTEFLTNLSIEHAKNELCRADDPPDVVFRDARFEVKEILDEGRRRHADYKQSLVKALAATDPKDLLEGYTPRYITIGEVYDLIFNLASDLAKRKYPPTVRESLDLLCYVDLDNVMGMVEAPYPDVSTLASLGYRSVSFLDGHRSGVFCAAPNSPVFLHSHLGITHRVAP